MKATLTPIASAVAFALLGTVAHAQQSAAQEPEKKAPAQQVAQAAQAILPVKVVNTAGEAVPVTSTVSVNGAVEVLPRPDELVS